jgi:predicted membrane-bound mannosyltransferase
MKMNKSWVKFGLVWGFFMAVVLNIGFPLFDGTAIDWTKAAVSVPFWIVAGLIFGYVSRKKKNIKKQIDQ